MWDRAAQANSDANKTRDIHVLADSMAGQLLRASVRLGKACEDRAKLLEAGENPDEVDMATQAVVLDIAQESGRNFSPGSEDEALMEKLAGPRQHARDSFSLAMLRPQWNFNEGVEQAVSLAGKALLAADTGPDAVAGQSAQDRAVGLIKQEIAEWVVASGGLASMEAGGNLGSLDGAAVARAHKP